MTWPMENTTDGTFENIVNDIACFANIGSVKEIKHPSKTQSTIEWKDLQISQTADFKIERDGIYVTHKGDRLSYKNFLSRISTLQYTAEQFLFLIKTPENTISAKGYFASDDAEIPSSQNLNEMLETSITAPATQNGVFVDRTKVFFIRGAAGSGKTVAMEDLVRFQANQFLAGKAGFLYLYIDVQSRALTRLDEAIAHVLDAFSLGIKFPSVKALTRNGLLVPIIDGFDELIGSGGYSDAFKSLSAFLASLEGQGALIATGRSVFYDENILKSSAERFSNNNSINYSIDTISISEWDDIDIKNFTSMKLKYTDQQDHDKLTNTLIRLTEASKHSTIFRKPFYVDKIVDLLLYENSNFDNLKENISEGSIIKFLIEEYINREVGKFKNKSDENVMSNEQHWYFLRQLALELWWQERRIIDNETIDAASELTLLNYNIPAEDWPIVIGKARTYAFLKTSSDYTQSSLQAKEFESQLYYDYLLAETVVEFLDEENDVFLKQFLSRSLLPESSIKYFMELTANFEPSRVQTAITKLMQIIPISAQGSLERQNIGAIISNMLHEKQVSDLHITGVEFSATAFYDTEIINSTFKNCFFKNFILSDCRITNCHFDNSQLYNIHIHDKTRLTGTKFNPNTTIGSLATERMIINIKSEIIDFLKSIGAEFEDSSNEILLNENQKQSISLLNIFLAKASKKYFFDLNHHIEPDFTKIFTSPHWKPLLKALRDSGVIISKQVDKKNKKGSNGILYHLTEPSEAVISSIFNTREQTSPNLQKFAKLFLAI